MFLPLPVRSACMSPGTVVYTEEDSISIHNTFSLLGVETALVSFVLYAKWAFICSTLLSAPHLLSILEVYITYFFIFHSIFHSGVQLFHSGICYIRISLPPLSLAHNFANLQRSVCGQVEFIRTQVYYASYKYLKPGDCLYKLIYELEIDTSRLGRGLLRITVSYQCTLVGFAHPPHPLDSIKNIKPPNTLHS